MDGAHGPEQGVHVAHLSDAGDGRERADAVPDRLTRLFDDVEAQLAAEDRAQLESDVADRTRAARAEVTFADRLRASTDRHVALRVVGADAVAGVVRQVAEEWLVLVEAASGTPTLVRLDAVLTGHGVVPDALPERSAVRERLSLRAILRSVARDRSPVRLWLVDGHRMDGTIDVVAHDHVELACHPWDEPRRPGSVREHQTVLFSAVAALRPARGTSSLGW